MSSIKSRSQSPQLLQKTEGLEVEQHLILSNILLNSIYFSNFSKALYKASGVLNENETTVFTSFLFTREKNENEQMEKLKHFWKEDQLVSHLRKIKSHCYFITTVASI